MNKLNGYTVMLLCLPRDQRETLKFGQETGGSGIGRVRWPAVYLEMIGEIWAETPQGMDPIDDHMMQQNQQQQPQWLPTWIQYKLVAA
jgi:hypothetical protein